MGPIKTAAALIIGNELLSGKIADENLVVLARTLRKAGAQLDRVVFIPDERAVIVDEVRALAASRDVLFTSGGVGPTHDDLTIDAVAEAFELPVVASAELEEMLRGYYGDGITDGHLRMARIPQGARLLRRGEMPWPTTVMNNVWILPGVPQIFAMKMPVVLSELGGGGEQFVSVAVRSTLDEGLLKPSLDRVVAEHPAVLVGSYPKWRARRFRTLITFDGSEEAAVHAARDAFVALLPAGALVPDPG